MLPNRTVQVTALVAESIANGRANINLVSKSYNIDVIAVDMGMITDVDDERIIIKKNCIWYKKYILRKRYDLKSG